MSKIDKESQTTNLEAQKIIDMILMLFKEISQIKEKVCANPTQDEATDSLSKKELINVKELSKLTGLSVAHIYQMRYYNSLPFPCYVIGKNRLRFKPNEVLASLKKNAQDYELTAEYQTYLANHKKH